MDLNAIKIFVSVAQTGSLSAASQKLEIPLPTVSRRIQELERQLNVQLLERSTRGTRLTDAGTRLYSHASRGIEMLDEAKRAVASDQAHLKGRLRLSIPPGFEPWWDLLSDFRSQFPDIQIQIYSTERRVDHVEDGIDVALRIGAIGQESIIARHVLTYRHVLVASPALIARKGTPTAPEDLYLFPCGYWSPRGDIRGAWQLGTDSITPEWSITTNDYWHLRKSAIAGEIVTELPPFLAAKAIREGHLISLIPNHPMPEQQVNLLYPSHRHPSAIVRAYLDFCKSRVTWLATTCAIPQTAPRAL